MSGRVRDETVERGESKNLIRAGVQHMGQPPERACNCRLTRFRRPVWPNPASKMAVGEIVPRILPQLF